MDARQWRYESREVPSTGSSQIGSARRVDTSRDWCVTQRAPLPRANEKETRGVPTSKDKAETEKLPDELVDQPLACGALAVLLVCKMTPRDETDDPLRGNRKVHLNFREPI